MLLAVVIPASHSQDGIEFFSDPGDSQQLGFMKRPAGYVVQPHWHKPVPREVRLTQEVLLMRSGRCVLDLYGQGDKVLHSVTLESGDVVWLVSGGHGITMTTECELIEVKQGPYSGDDDKVRFSPET